MLQIPYAYEGGFAVASSNTASFTTRCRALWVGAAGTVSVRAAHGSAFTYQGVPAGTYLFGNFVGVNETGTSAASMIARTCRSASSAIMAKRKRRASFPTGAMAGPTGRRTRNPGSSVKRLRLSCARPAEGSDRRRSLFPLRRDDDTVEEASTTHGANRQSHLLSLIIRQ